MNIEEIEARIQILRTERKALENDSDALIEELDGCETMAAVESYVNLGLCSSGEDLMLACEIESLGYIKQMMSS